MHILRPSFRTSISVLVSLLLLVACGGAPGPGAPTGATQVDGTIVLPTGHGIDLASLVVTTPLGTYPVAADGTFSADVLSGAHAEIGVETGAGALLLLGTSQGSSVGVSVESTAVALLYYLVGGMWLPADQQDTVRDLLRGIADADTLATELRRQLLAGGNGLATPDAGTLAALDAAQQALFADVSIGALAAAGRAAAPTGAIGRTEVDGTNILIEPGDATQSGAQVLHNPSGAGVVAQNRFRRPAALLAYEVGWEDADGVLNPVDPPEFAGEVDVPATGQLELFAALFDVVTGDAPWAPVLSPSLGVAGRAEASRTHYQLVLLGPSTSAAVPALMSDARFTEFHDGWDDVLLEKSLELFLDELLLPIVEVYGLGGLAKYDAARVTQMRTRVRVIADEHLLGLGVYLRAGRTGYADALRFAITRLVESREFRLELMDTVFEALVESDRNRAAIEAMERRLTARASATAVAAAVEAALVGGDVAKIMYDLSESVAAEGWTVISAQALFSLAPARAIVTRTEPSARFGVTPKGTLTGSYRYRWTTSGTHGTISDLLQDGTAIDTDSSEIWYFHDRPLGIEDDDVDSISVEVFEVEPGASSIPAGAQPVARMAASVRGDDILLDSRIEVNYGSTHPDLYGKSYGCVEMLLRFDAEPGADTYTVRIRGVGGQGDERNGNQDFRVNGPNKDVFIDPDARTGAIHEAGYVGPYHGVCTWINRGHYALPPITASARYDAVNDQFVVNLFTTVQSGFGTSSSVSVPLWHEWVEHATFEVVVSY
jgi:hypothetical protein